MSIRVTTFLLCYTLFLLGLRRNLQPLLFSLWGTFLINSTRDMGVGVLWINEINYCMRNSLRRCYSMLFMLNLFLDVLEGSVYYVRYNIPIFKNCGEKGQNAPVRSDSKIIGRQFTLCLSMLFYVILLTKIAINKFSIFTPL